MLAAGATESKEKWEEVEHGVSPLLASSASLSWGSESFHWDPGIEPLVRDSRTKPPPNTE